MANLLNVLQPATSNKTASLAGTKESVEFSSPSDASELGLLFQKNLQSQLSPEVPSEIANEKNIELNNNEKMDEVLAASGMLAAPKEVPVKNDLLQNAQGFVEKQSLKPIDQLQSLKSGIEIKASASRAEPAMTIQPNHSQKDLLLMDLSRVDATMMDSSIMDSSLNDGTELGEFGDVELESVSVKDRLPKKQALKQASSKLSTSDFMSLREISKNQVPVTNPNPTQVPHSTASLASTSLAELPVAIKANAYGLKAMEPSHKEEKQGLDDAFQISHPLNPQSSQSADRFQAIVEGKVTQAEGSKPVLTPESIHQIGHHVNLIGKAQQDGEIKIRLRPDHLGELKLSVRTEGRNVSVEIKAENQEARKIIEESLSTLRDQLSSQNLSLARVDVVNQPTSVQSPEAMPFQMDSGSNWNETGRQSGSDSRDQEKSSYSWDDSNVIPVKSQTNVRSFNRNINSNRLDMIA